jgi:prepilin peptidase CpaA
LISVTALAPGPLADTRTTVEDPTMIPETAMQAIVLSALSGVLVFAALTDARRLVIPNRVSLAVLGLFPLWLAVAPTAFLPQLLPAALTGIAVLALGFLLFAGGLLGGGDVKLLAALAVWAGPDRIVALIVVTVLAGGALAAFCLIGLAWKRVVGPVGGAAASVWREPLPYGCAVAVGGIDLVLRHLPA